MRSNQKLKLPKLPKKNLAVAILWIALTLAFAESDISKSISESFHQFDFLFRKYLASEPLLSEKIKVIAIDQNTVQTLGRTFLTPNEWSALLSGVLKRRPKALYFDGLTPEIQAMGQEFSRLLKRYPKTKIILPLSFEKEPVYHKELIQKTEFIRLSQLVKYDYSSGSKVRQIAKLNIPRAKSEYLYGPLGLGHAGSAEFGHFDVESGGRIAPFLRRASDSVIPHAALLLADEIRYIKGYLNVDRSNLSLDSQGFSRINFVNEKSFLSSVESAKNNLDGVAKKNGQWLVSPGDIVYIDTDFYKEPENLVNSAIGLSRKSYVDVSTISSLIENNWLVSVEADLVISLFAVAFSFLIATYVMPWMVPLGMGLFSFVWICTSIVGFSFYGIVFPWAQGLFGFIGCSISFLSIFKVEDLKKKQRIVKFLSGSISNLRMNQMLQKPNLVSFQATESRMMIVSIDSPGLAILSGTSVEPVVIRALNRVMKMASDFLKSQGGIILSESADRFVCGFDIVDLKGNLNPPLASKMFAAIMHLRDSNLKGALQAHARSEPVVPLKIGVHYGSVVLGDLNYTGRTRISALGPNVEISRLLSERAELFSVIVSERVGDMFISKADERQTFRLIQIEVSSARPSLACYAVDPGPKIAAARQKAEEAFRHSARLIRREKRHRGLQNIQIKTEFGGGRIVNFSNCGVSVELTSELVRGSKLFLEFMSNDPAFSRKIGKEKIMAQVRWTEPSSSGKFMHGLILKGESIKLYEPIFQFLMENISSDRSSEVLKVS